MRKSLTKIFLFFIAALPLCQAQSDFFIPELSAENLKTHIHFLGHDSLAGRETGRPGGYMAAEYIAKQFHEYRLSQGPDNSYHQMIPMHASTPLVSSELHLIMPTGEKYFELGEDYVLYKSGDQTFIPNPLPMVFAGYGIIAPEFDYNDYHDFDVSGKIVVLLEGEPISDDADYFAGEYQTIYSAAETKQRLAFSRGASGTIIIPNAASKPAFNWNTVSRLFSFEEITLAYSVAGHLGMMMNPESAELLFEGSASTLQDVYWMHENQRMNSFPLETLLSFKGDFEQRDFLASNVIGVIEGRDPDLKGEYVVVSAHYDHLGIGAAVKGDSIYNGVFDNAMGCAGLLELARAFSDLRIKPRRTILFIALTGEEHGLLGSVYYTDSPIFPLYKTAAAFNIDGLAAFDTFNDVIGVGTEYSTLDGFLERAAEINQLYVSEMPAEYDPYEAFLRSDQIAFATAGIPALIITEGTDYRNISRETGLRMLYDYMRNRYHTPFDDLTQEINYEAAIQNLEVLYTLIYLTANSDEAPEWKDGSPFINARLQSRAEKR